jgi:hypothetical protein
MIKTVEVGLENLPNCYIKLVEIEDVTLETRKHTIHIVIKDIRNKNGEYLWYNKDNLFEYMKIVVLLTASGKKIQETDEGTGDFIDIHSSVESYSYQQIVSLQGAGVEKIEELPRPEGALCSFLYKVEIETPNVFPATNRFRNDAYGQNPLVKLYAAIMIDIPERFSRYTNIIRSLREFHGPIASETVYIKSSLDETNAGIDLRQANPPETSYAFESPVPSTTPTAFPGPVHIREEVVDGDTVVSFAAGSFPSGDEEQALLLTAAQSFKTKDYTVFNNFTMDISQPPTDIDQFVNEQPMFAQRPEYSYDAAGRVSSLFTINLRSILLRNSVYADRLYHKSAKIVNSLVPNIVLSKVVIYKKKIQNIAGIDEAGDEKLLAESRDDNQPYNFEFVFDDNVFFKEMMLDSDPNHRSFGLYEKNSDSDAGVFQYRIEVEFVDPIRKYLYDYLDKLNDELFLYKSYVEEIEANTLGDESGYLPSSLAGELIRRYTDLAPWNRMISCYLELWQLMVRFDYFPVDVDMLSYAKRLLTFCHPSVATKKSIRVFEKLVSKGISEFVEYFELDTSSISEVAQNSNFVLNRIQDEKTYNNATTEHRMLSKGLNRSKNIEYLPDALFQRNAEPFPVLEEGSLQQYLFMNEYNVNSSGYFYNLNTTTGTPNAFASGEASVSYLSPKALNFANLLRVDVSNPVTTNSDLFSTIFNSILGIDPTTTTVFEESAEAADAAPVSDLLGEGSDFDQSDESDTEELTTFGSVELFNVLPFATKASLSLNNESALLNDLDTLRALPKSIKSVLNNQQGFLDASNSFIESPSTSQLFRLGFLSPVIMRRLQPHGTDTAQSEASAQTFVNNLVPNPVFIRLDYISLNLAGISVDTIASEVAPLTHTDGSLIPIANQTFVLYNYRLPRAKDFDTVETTGIYSIDPTQIQIGTVYNQEYVTSSPIKQRLDKSSFLKPEIYGQTKQQSETIFADVTAAAQASSAANEALPDANTEQVQVSGPQSPY